MKRILLLFCFLPLLSYSQDCDCPATFDWVRKTFEENDAGFQYILEAKGEQAYTLHNQIFADKIKQVSQMSECHELMNNWFLFFRKGHIGLEYMGPSPDGNSEESAEEEEKDTQADTWETYSTNLAKFKASLDKKEEPDMEGIWETGPYTLAIKRDAENYIGFIVESEVDAWKKGHVKLKISEGEAQPTSVFYMFNRSAVKSDQVALLSPNNLQIGDIFLSRVYPAIEDKSPYQLHFKAMDSNLPFMERLNASTLYFRIPSFSGTPEKIAIDSVIAANKSDILSTENLIIDIRYGTGGSDMGYYEILPLIYTNPIRTPVAEFLSTPLNNQRMLDFSKNEGMAIEYNITFSEEEKKEFKRYYDILSKREGEFVNLDTSVVNITKYDTVYAYPKHVAVMHNHRNGSTDEQFLLAAKQSRKVKLFGTKTMGALDVSNLNKAVSPCGDFALWYALSKSRRIPEMAIDDFGIQPDFYIDKEIPEYKWIEFVVDMLNQ